MLLCAFQLSGVDAILHCACQSLKIMENDQSRCLSIFKYLYINDCLHKTYLSAHTNIFVMSRLCILLWTLRNTEPDLTPYTIK